METLNEQIKHLKAEDKFKKETKKALKNIEHLCYISDKDFRIIPKCKNVEEFNQVLKAFKPTNKQTVIGTARDSYFKTLKTPFEIKLLNPCIPNQWNNFNIQIEYKSGKNDINITLPIETVKDFIIIESRKITDSEYHYFIGTTLAELHRMQVRSYNFKGLCNDEVINWYGGDKTLLKLTMINDIIKTLTNL